MRSTDAGPVVHTVYMHCLDRNEIADALDMWPMDRVLYVGEDVVEVGTMLSTGELEWRKL